LGIRNLYNLEEQRDLNFYELDLGQERIKFLIYHLYELRKARYGYYFLTENCAYQIAAILEIAYGVSVDGYKYNFPIIPMDILNAYKDNITNQFLLEATLRRSQVLIEGMSKYELSSYKAVQRDGIEVNEELSDNVKEVLNIEGEYQSQRFGNISKDYNKTIDPNFSQALCATSILSPSANNGKHLLNLGAYKDHESKGVLLGYRLLGRDIYDPQLYKIQESNVVFIEAQLKLMESGKLQVQQFDLFRIKSLLNRGSLASSKAWSVNLGVNRLNKNNKAVGDFSMALGRGYDSKRAGVCCLGTLGIQNKVQEGRLYLMPSVDMIFYPFDKVKIGLLAMKKYGLHDSYGEVNVFVSKVVKKYLMIADYSASEGISGNSLSLTVRTGLFNR